MSARPRVHALDALRASMMVLGVAMHAGLSYGGMPAGPIWGVKDAHRTPLADALMFFSGSFRMPIFFAMAGFFAALICERRGPWGLLRNRLLRIGLPFAVGWAITFPALRAAFAYAGASADKWGAVAELLRSGRAWSHPYPIHLWFLEYLLIYYVGATLLAPTLARLIPAGWFRASLATPWRALPMAGISAVGLLLFASPMGGFGTPLTFAPELPSLVGYAVFFGFGWALYRHADLLPGLADHAGRQWAFALLAAPLGIVGMMLRFRGGPPPSFDGATGPPPMMGDGGLASRALGASSTALVAWCLLFGITGLFVRHLDRPSARLRYLTDASYWLYLMHFPLVAWVAIPMLGLPLPGLVKLVLNVVISIALLLATFEVFVRRTPLRSILGGTRPASPGAPS